MAAFLGAITPFCSCSTIPFLKGLLRARAGFGPMMVFLFASPLLNPVIIGLFIATFGLNVAVFYFAVAMVVAVSAGFILEKLGFEKYVRPEAYESTDSGSSCGTSCGDSVPEVQVSCCSSIGEAAATIVPSAEPSRWVRIWINTWKDFKQVLPYLLIGIALGSLIYGFIPTDLIAEYAGAGMLSL